MSVQAMSWVMDSSQMTGMHYTVLLVIANHQGERGAWPSVDRVARESRVSVRTAQGAIRAAERCGELVVHLSAGPHRTNIYHLAVPHLVDCTDCTPQTTGARLHPNVKNRVTGSLVPETPTVSNLSRQRRRDVLQDALIQACGISSDDIGKAEARKYAMAAVEIRSAGFDPPDFEEAFTEVERRARNYARRFPQAAVTPNAIATHWGESANAPGGITSVLPGGTNLHIAAPRTWTDEERAEYEAAVNREPWRMNS